MQTIKRISTSLIVFTLAALLLVAFIPAQAFAEGETGELIEGSYTSYKYTYDENDTFIRKDVTGHVSWTLQDGVLTITGDGDLIDNEHNYGSDNDYHFKADYLGKNWRSYIAACDVQKIIIDSDFDRIGEYTLSCYPANPEEVIINGHIGEVHEGALAFAQKLTLNGSIDRLDFRAFLDCKDVNLNGNIGWAQLNDKGSPFYSAININIGSSVTELGPNVFNDCCAIEVTLPGSLGRVSDRLFQSSKCLNDVVLEEGITSIGDCSFKGTSLKRIGIPRSVKHIGIENWINSEDPGSCKLEGIYYAGTEEEWNAIDSVSELPEGVTIYYNTGSPVKYVQNLINDIGTVTLDKLEKIELARAEYDKLMDYNKARVGDLLAVLEAAEIRFNECVMELVTIEDGVMTIRGNGPMVWYGEFPPWADLLEPVRKIVICEGVTSIKKNAFSSYTKTEEIELPSTLRSIEDHALYSCQYLKKLELPDGIEKIGKEVIRGVHLDELVIPGSVRELGVGAFTENYIDQIFIEEGVESVPERCFEYSVCLYSLSLPKSLKHIGANAFYDAYPLEHSDYSVRGVMYAGDANDFKSLTIEPEGNEYLLAADVFYGCHNIYDAFAQMIEGCINEDFTVPDSDANEKAQLLKSVYYSYTKEDRDRLSDQAKVDIDYICRQLEGELDNYHFVEDEGACIDAETDGKVIAADKYAENKTINSVYVPDGVETIGAHAFSGCIWLYDVSLPASLRHIDASAFDGCYNLSNVFFRGSEEEWNKVDIDETGQGNHCLEYADLFYNCGDRVTALKQSLLELSDTTLDSSNAERIRRIIHLCRSLPDEEYDTILYGEDVADIYDRLYTELIYYDEGRRPPVDLAKADINIDARTCTYNFGYEVQPKVTIAGLTEGRDFEVYYYDNSYVGTGSIYIQSLNNETCEGTVTIPFEILPAQIASAKPFLESSTYAYTGRAINPDIECRYPAYYYDYKLSYSNNVNIGTGMVTVTGIENFRGTATLSFDIVPARAKISSAKAGKKKATLKIKAQAGGVNYEIRYRTGKGKWKTKTAAKNKLTLKKLKPGKTYQVQVRAYKTVGSRTYYGSWSKTKKVKVK